MALEQAGVQLIAAGGDVYITTINNATKATNNFVDSTDQGSNKVKGAGQVMIGALREIGTIAVDALAQAAKATAAFVGDSINLAGDFEAGMLNFQAVAGKDVDTKGLEQFRDLFLQIGKELPVSTADVQKAAIEMIKGGIDPAIVAAGGLRQNIQFAAAAMDGDLVSAAEISSKILGGWAASNATAAEKADFLTHSTDLLTKAANASAVDVKGLSLGIFNAQGIAKTAGVSFDDLTTTLAALAPRFASSSEAGNSLKNMIARLQPTTDPAASAMEGLGLYTEETGSKFYDAQGNFVGFEKAAQLLQDSLKGLTKEQQAATLQQIFGNDAMGSAAALADMGAEGYRNMAAAMGEANGVAENAALKQQGFNTALDNAKGSLEALQITIGSALLPVLTDLMNNVIAPAVNTLTDMADALFGNEEAFNRLSPAMQDVVTTIGTLVDDVQNIVGAFDEAGAMSSEFGESIGLLASDLGLPGELIQDIVFAAQDLIKWFSTASDKSSDLGGVIDDLNGIWTKAGVVIDDVMDAYMVVAQAVLPVITQFIADHGEEISTFFQTAYNKIIEIINLALDLYDAIVPKVLGNVAAFITEHADSIQTILSGAWQAISGIIDGALTLIEGTFKIALDIIHGDWSKAWEDIKTMSATFVLDLGKVIEGFLNIIAGFFDSSLAEIVDTWTNNWNQLVDIATSIDWGNIGYLIVAGIIGGIDDNADRLFSTLKNLASDALQAAKDALGISSPSKEFAKVGNFAVQGLIQGFADTWPQLTAFVGTISKDLIDEMSDIGTQMQDAIADGFGATASIDRQLAKNLDSIKDVLPGYLNYTKGALKEAQDQAMAFLDPAEGAKFFKKRSDQIFEYAKLQKDLAETTDADDRARIQEQMNLINAAQTAELRQMDAQRSASESATDGIVQSIDAVMRALAGIHLTDDQIKVVDMLAGVWSGLQMQGNARQQAYANPPQMQYPSSSGGSTSNRTTNVNMPIYTNNSPAALQQSWAIVQASMP